MLNLTNRSNQQSQDGDTPIEVSAQMVAVSVTLTRPNNVIAYSALDAVSNSTGAPTALNFANVARLNGGSGYIIKARLMTDQATNVARYRLHLFSTLPAAINDNSPYTLLWANRAARVGEIDFYAADDEGAGSTAAKTFLSSGDGNLPLAFICNAADRDLYGLLETLDAFTPAALQNFFIELTAEIN